MAPVLDLLRLFAGVTVLSFAAYTDWEWRRAPNVLWLILAGIGLVLFGAQVALDPSILAQQWPYLVFVPVFVGIIYGLWYVGLIAGGADAKALMALAVLMPFPVAIADALPLAQSPVPGAFSVLGNSMIVFLLIPLSLAVWNLAHGAFRFPHLFLGVRRPAEEVRRGHVWPMETVDEEGRRETRLFASRMGEGEIDETFARIQALGREKVWVTPKIPFMIPLLVGFVLTFVVGDLLVGTLARVLG